MGANSLTGCRFRMELIRLNDILYILQTTRPPRRPPKTIPMSAVTVVGQVSHHTFGNCLLVCLMLSKITGHIAVQHMDSATSLRVFNLTCKLYLVYFKTFWSY